MWLLKLHFFISVLCFLTCFVIMKFGKFRLSKNGWGYPIKKFNIKKLRLIFGLFIPILNIFLMATLIVMTLRKKKDFYKMFEEAKKNSEV